MIAVSKQRMVQHVQPVHTELKPPHAALPGLKLFWMGPSKSFWIGPRTESRVYGTFPNKPIAGRSNTAGFRYGSPKLPAGRAFHLLCGQHW